MSPGWKERITMDYIAYLHKEKASDFGVSFPDFPGCITAGVRPERRAKCG